jgi:peptidyl-prolyl cis-trans isomerase D
MALKWLRDNLRHLKFVLWGVVAVFVLLVFVDWGAGRSGPGASGEPAVRIGDRVVTEQEFLIEMRLMNQRFEQLYGDRWNELRDQVDLPGQTVAYFIDRELRLAEARRVGLVVSDEELRERILSDPLFQDQGGNFVGSDRYQRAIRSYFRMSPQEFETRYAQDLLVGKLDAMMIANAYVDDVEVEEAYRRQSEKADFDVIQLRYEPRLADVVIGEEDVTAHYEAHAEEYRREEQRIVRYLVVENSKLRRLLPATDAELEAYYQEHIDEFLEGEQAHARHILIRTAPGAPEGERVEARTRAEGVLKIAETGADFGELAAKHSADPGSKDNGGDLGWFGRGQMVKEFEDAVWGGKPGDILGPVESQFGYHIIRVEGFKPERQQPFDEVREQVRFRYLEGRAAAEAELRARELARRLESERPQTEEDWQKIADEDEAVVLNLSPPFGAEDTVPGTGGGSELAVEAFAADIGDLGEPRAIPRGWMVWQLSQIRPSGVPGLEEVRAEVEQELRREKALELTMSAAAELAERWRAGEATDALVEEYGGTSSEVREHSRGAAIGGMGGSLALDDLVFVAGDGSVIGPVQLGSRGVAVAKVERVQAMDAADLEQQRDDIRNRLQVQRAQSLLQSILEERRRDTVVTVNDELMGRYAPAS